MAKLARRIVPAALGWLWFAAIAGGSTLFLWDHLRKQTEGESIVWKHPLAPWLAGGALLVGWAAFHLRRHRSASFAYSRVEELARTRTSLVDLMVGLPGALRMTAIAAMAVALARPQTFRTVTKEVDSIDIVIVFDLSKSMEETDLPRDRLDAAQRVVRKFVKTIKNDRVGLVVFAQKTMVQCPPTTDMRVLDRIIANMAIGDIPEYGTAIGDGLGLGLAQLKKERDRRAAAALNPPADAPRPGETDAERLARLADQARQDQRRETLRDYVLFGSFGCALFLLLPLALRRRYPGKTGRVFAYSMLAAVLLALAVNVVGRAIIGDRPADAPPAIDVSRPSRPEPAGFVQPNNQVVILLSDGDSNVAEHFDPDDAARVAKDMKVKVFTVLVGSEEAGFMGGMGVNPATMRSIADTTGGEFFRATDQAKFEAGFKAMRQTLEKTKRKVTERIPDKELYTPLLLLAAAMLALEILLSLTRFRRFP